MRSESINELAAALAKAQGAMDNAVMNKINPHFKSRYADLSSVRDAFRKPLADNGLSITQTMEIRETGLVLVTTLMHSSGQWKDSEYPLPTVARPQELGSALTFGRRYSAAAIVCNSSDEDDDAENAEKAEQKVDAKGKSSPIKPQKVITPVGPPHLIPVQRTPDGSASDWMGWGGLFVAAVSSAKNETEVLAWETMNETQLEALKADAPKVSQRVDERLKATKDTFHQTK